MIINILYDILIPPNYFIASATIAANAIEFTLTSNSSERDVKITGAFVPVKMLPFLTSAV